METLYKLTDKDGFTRKEEKNETLWIPGNEYKATGIKPLLCTDGVIHAYRDAILGILLNPTHADLRNPRLFTLEGTVIAEDWGKVGCVSVKCISEIEVPEITIASKVAFGILCAKTVYTDEKWLSWADSWLMGQQKQGQQKQGQQKQGQQKQGQQKQGQQKHGQQGQQGQKNQLTLLL